MKTVPLGSTGVNVSILCLGAMYFGTEEDETTSFRLLDQYLDAGGTFIDTANIYAHWVPGFKGGESEALLGRWMRARRNRDRLFIATKVGFEIPPQGVERGLKARRIVEECEKSLKRLGVETIDLYYAHRDDRDTPQEESLAAFDRLVRDGKVRFIGASNFLAWRLEEARWISRTHGWAEYCCIQQRYTYLRPNPGASFDPQTSANDDLLDYVRSRDLTLLAYSPLLGGQYVDPNKPLQRQYVSADSVILAWMMQSDPAVIPVFGASGEAQMAENLGALEVKLSAAQMERLNQAGV